MNELHLQFQRDTGGKVENLMFEMNIVKNQHDKVAKYIDWLEDQLVPGRIIKTHYKRHLIENAQDGTHKR